jgi:hypothetical protein
MPLRYNASAPVPGVPGGLTVPVLASGQYSIDNFVFGRGTQITVAQTAIDAATITAQDQPYGARDGQRFGVDYMTTGKVYTFTGSVLMDDQFDTIGAMDVYNEFESFWNNPAVRLNPGDASILRFRYPNSPTTRRVWGRGRAITPALGMVSRGSLPYVAAFQASDNTVYSDFQYSAMLKLVAGGNSTNVVNLMSNPNFTSGTQGWSWSSGNLTVNTAIPGPSGGYAGVFVPPGGTNNVAITSPFVPISLNKTYVTNLDFQIPSALSVALTYRVMLYDISFNPISAIRTNTITGSGTGWTLSSASWATAISNAKYAALEVVYGGTPLTTDVVHIANAIIQFPGSGVVWPGGVGMTLPLTTARVTSSEERIVNLGSTDTWPVIVINGPVTNPFVNFIEPDVGIQLQTTIPRGIQVKISTLPWNTFITDQNGNSYGGDVVGNALAELSLAPGITTAQFGGQDASGISYAQVFWRSAYTMIGGTGL